jgi:hypothetical protein
VFLLQQQAALRLAQASFGDPNAVRVPEIAAEPPIDFKEEAVIGNPNNFFRFAIPLAHWPSFTESETGLAPFEQPNEGQFASVGLIESEAELDAALLQWSEKRNIPAPLPIAKARKEAPLPTAAVHRTPLPRVPSQMPLTPAIYSRSAIAQAVLTPLTSCLQPAHELTSHSTPAYHYQPTATIRPLSPVVLRTFVSSRVCLLISLGCREGAVSHHSVRRRTHWFRLRHGLPKPLPSGYVP